jgi:Asp/Glu/hydantoin racemase
MARIWYQSFVHPVEQAPYIERLQGMLTKVAAAGVSFEVHGLDPPDHSFHALTEFRCAAQVIGNAIEAEKAGYDAFVIGHFQDAGLYEARSVVDIPVLALGESSMLHGCQLGQRSGIITINPRYIPWFHHQITKYGLERRVAGTHAMTFEPGQILRARSRNCSPNRRGRWSQKASRC